jgi:N-acetylglucosamine malate deacetylase 2
MVAPNPGRTSDTKQPTQKAPRAGAKADAPGMPAAGSPDGKAGPAAAVRQAARMAALETELRLLGKLAAPGSVERLRPYAAVAAPQLRTRTIIRSRNDPRFRVERGELVEALRQFDGDLDGEAATARTLIVVAHPDDEAVGAGAQLARLDDVTVLHVTDGAPRTPGYAERMGFSSADEYREFRRLEVRTALSLAGIPVERQLCMGIADGEAPYHLVELSLGLAERFDELKPEVVVTHPYEGGHTDHDAVAFAVHLACGVLRREGAAVPRVLELTSYHVRDGQRVVHDFLPHPEVDVQRTVRLSREARELKRRMYESFRSQQRCLQQFATDIERFRPAPRYVFTRPPHEGTLDYERRCKRMTGADWRSQAARALDQLRTRRRGWVSCTEEPLVRTWSASATSRLYTPDPAAIEAAPEPVGLTEAPGTA